MENKKYFSRKEAARYLNISESALTQLSRKGSPRFSKLAPGKSGKVLYDVSDLDAFVESHRVNVNM